MREAGRRNRSKVLGYVVRGEQASTCSRGGWHPQDSGGFAAAALVLAVVGIYGVIAYAVAQRTRELGIRIALGARRADVFALVLRHGALLALAGIATGTLAALALSRSLASVLYGVSTSDPVTYVAVALLLAAVAVAASLVPARRATRVDPATVMRSE